MSRTACAAGPSPNTNGLPASLDGVTSGSIGTAEASFWGRSEVLGLTICWEDEKLRWWDPAAERYLETHAETLRARDDAETQANVERAARLRAEARIRELEAELERRQQS